MLPNILPSKDNQTMRFGQLVEYNKRNTFLKKNHSKNETGKVNFKIYAVTTWSTNNYNTYIAQYLTK